MIQKILNTLHYRLRRELREWRRANAYLRETDWPWYMRALIAAGEHPVRIPLELLSIVIGLSATVWAYHALTTLVSSDPVLSPPNIQEHFSTLWTVQAAIAAMIYPIVIGFVTLLLQRRHSAKASLHIYLHYSAAILTGLSALFLVATMGVQFVFIPIASESVVFQWLILDVAWFLVNILGTIWFLARTFDYLRPERRAEIMRAYAINHVWPAELRSNLEYNLFCGAIHYGWLPGPVYGDEENESNTAIIPSPVGRSMGDIQVTVRRKRSWTILDVRFRLLSLAVRSWQRRESNLATSSEQHSVASAGTRHKRLLILPSIPGESYENDVGLCRVEGGSGLRWWERWLIRKSFVLSPSTGQLSTLNISDILNGLITEVQVAMETGEEVVFREALHELVDLHTALLQAGDFVTDAGQHGNYANLVDRHHAFEARIHDLWTREYRRLFDAAIERLATSTTYFNYLVHVPGWILSRFEEIRPIEISVHLLQLSCSLHYRLNRWWSKIGEEQGLLKHGPCEPGALNAPAFTVYDSAIKEFVGAWESLKNDRFPPTRDEPPEWGTYGEVTILYTAHLDGTLHMLFDSLSLGNKEGAEWLCDSLIKWWNTIRFRFDNIYYYIRDERNLTLEILNTPWEEARRVIDLSMVGNDEENAPKAIWTASIYNYWTDLTCVALYAMLQLGKGCTCEMSLPAQLAAALSQGKALRAGGAGIGEGWPIRSIEDLLIAIIRQYYFDGGYHRGYRSRLNKVIEGISNQGKPAMVPGRIYSGWGLEDLDSLRDGQLILLCLFAKEGWTPSARLMEIIQQWGSRDDAGLRAFVDLLKQWKTRLTDADYLAYDTLFSCIQQRVGVTASLRSTISVLDAGIHQIITGIEGFRIEQLRDAQISDERLEKVASWSSRSGFSKDNAATPISLFREVQYSREQYTEHSLTIRGINKGELVDPPMAQRAGNEAEWFDRTISSHVAGSVMTDILKTIILEIAEVDSPVGYWQQIKLAAMRIRNDGGTPILLVAGRADPHCLLEWTRNTYDERADRPEDPRLIRDKQFKTEGYIGSLNDIPVFVAPIGPGSSYLIPLEVMNTLSFTEHTDGVFVQISFEPVEGNDGLINLKLSWHSKLDLDAGKSWQLRYVRTQVK
ncbi:MAG: hypothetical protein K8I04_03900 [Gammaproteobacteria bacterium]|nr:hypothetical protein [Gammaproteobacteria bacterium]